MSVYLNIFRLLLFVSFGSLAFTKREKGDDYNVLETTISSLLSAELQTSNDRNKKVAVGFGSCLDVMVSALNFFGALQWSEPELTQNYDFIETIEQFHQTFAYFFQRGASAGRYTTNAELFEQIYSSMKSLGAVVRLGGNAPVMSRRFSKENATVLLMADVSLSSAINGLDDSIKVAGNKTELEDIHLIFEYEKGEKWGSLEAPRANRFILYKSSKNTAVPKFDKFLADVFSFQPDILVVGGFRVLSQNVHDDGRLGLEHLEEFLVQIPTGIKIHVELSSFSRIAELQSVVKHAVTHADSLGMNEQELPNLMNFLESKTSISDGAPSVASTFVSESKPSLASTLDSMRAVVSLLKDQQCSSRVQAVQHFRGSLSQSSASYSDLVNDSFTLEADDISKVKLSEQLKIRIISRIHVHTLAFQAIVTVDNEEISSQRSHSKFSTESIGGDNDSCSGKKNGYVNFNKKKSEMVLEHLSECDHFFEGKFSQVCNNEETSLFVQQAWKDSSAAAAKSALTANRHTCGTEFIELNNTFLFFFPNVSLQTSLTISSSPQLNFNPSRPVTCWKEGMTKIDSVEFLDDGEMDGTLEVCVAPVVVCKKVKQTVGGGDNVSAAAIVLQV